MRLIISTLLSLIYTISFSKSTIKGVLLEQNTNTPVAFANIALHNAKDSSFIAGVFSEENGSFIINDVKNGTYYIDIISLGNPKKRISGIEVAEKEVNLGNIILETSVKQLQEVEVSGYKEVNQVKIDKQTYKAEQFGAAKGGTAIDVLRNMPSVSVNAEGEVRLRGSTGFLVLINGKPVNADLQTVLNQIPANAVENIEIITAPTAKYDADGKSGIINITTKKGTDDGLTFAVNGQYGLPSVDMYNNKVQPRRYGSDFTLNYKKDKWDISAGASYLQNDLQGFRDGDVNTTINNIYTSFPSKGERSFDRRNYAARANISYAANKRNTISTGFYVGQRQQFRLADIVYDNIRSQNGTEINRFNYFNNNLVKKQGDFALANLDYTHTFLNKSTLNVSGLYEYALLDGFTQNKDYPNTNATELLNFVNNTGRSPIHGIRGKIDYGINIGKGKLESGYQIRHQRQTGKYIYENVVLNRNQLNQIVPDFTADIDIYNLIHGLYSQYSGKTDKLEYIVGMRYEHSQRVFKSNKGDNFPLYLDNLFPSANLLYNIKPDLKAKGGFSRRVQRSTNNELNPYPEREHSETLEQGDPRIRPEFVNLSELGLIKDFKNGSVFFTFYNQYIQNVVNRVNSVYNDTILNRIYTNAGNATSWGLESGFNYKPVKWWTIYAGGNVYDYRVRGSLFDNTVAVNNRGLVYNVNTNQNFQLKKTLSLQLNVNYISLRPTAQGEDSRFFSPNLSVKKTFLSGKISAMFQWQNIGLGIFPSNEQRITTRGRDFYTTTNYIQEKDVFWVHLSYNFKQTNRKVKLPSSEFGEREF